MNRLCFSNIYALFVENIHPSFYALQLFFNLSLLLYVQSNPVISVNIVGAVLVQCGKPVLHTVPGTNCLGSVISDEVNPDCSSSRTTFLPDWGTKCLKDASEVLDYCHKLYDDRQGRVIRHVISAPFAIPIDHWPGQMVATSSQPIVNQSIWVRPYWCISKSSKLL